MPDAWLLTAAFAFNLLGLAWLALAMEVHWEQVWPYRDRANGTARRLRLLGACALVASLILCLFADHASMASLVWITSLAPAAGSVAFLLAWRPRWLSRLA